MNIIVNVKRVSDNLFMAITTQIAHNLQELIQYMVVDITTNWMLENYYVCGCDRPKENYEITAWVRKLLQTHIVHFYEY